MFSFSGIGNPLRCEHDPSLLSTCTHPGCVATACASCSVTCAGVRSFFKHVPHQLGLPGNMTLPVYTQREYSKSVWDMQLHGVRGVVNLVLIFDDQESSLAGAALLLNLQKWPMKETLSLSSVKVALQQVSASLCVVSVLCLKAVV